MSYLLQRSHPNEGAVDSVDSERGLIEFQETSDTLSFKEQIEKENIYNALVNNNGNIPMAAKQLSISKSTLYRKIKKYKLD